MVALRSGESISQLAGATDIYQRELFKEQRLDFCGPTESNLL
jgi:hypothetical protein